MKPALIACLAAALLSAPASAKNISYDNGGLLTEYWIKTEAARRSGEEIRFTGPCRSACTLYLRLPAKRLCATEDANFWFHAPYAGGSPGADAQNKEIMMHVYPSWVVTYIWQASKGKGLTSKWIFMGSWVALKHMKECGAKAVTN
jgi:hypothetical protein